MTFKNLAKKARNRLIGACEEKEKTTSRALSVQTSYYISASKPIFDDPLYPKFKKMLDSNRNLISPIGKLIEKDIYDKLSPAEKDKYLLELTKRYNEMLKRYESETSEKSEV